MGGFESPLEVLLLECSFHNLTPDCLVHYNENRNKLKGVYFMIYAIMALFFVIPIIAVIGWVLNLIKYCNARRENKLNPYTHSKEEMKAIKSNLIISSVIAFVLMAVVVGAIVMFAMSIAYM